MIARLRSAVSAAFHVERGMMVRLLLAWIAIPAAALHADEPLRELINRELAPPSGTAWPKANDAEFLRRVSLDLNGMPPSADEARAFINDPDPAKREKLVDRLLASPLYARHLSTTLDVMLMERRPNTHVPQDQWQAFLLKSVRDNKPWNVLAREIMTADGDTPENRAAARFYLDRNSEPHVITRDLGRMFFGRDMQCNQCHDSPLVADFLQRDYHGLLAIASVGYPVTKKVAEKDVTVFAERAPSDLSFESVFEKGNMHRTIARLPGAPSFTEPVLFPGEDYTVAPADGVRAVPKFSRRAMMAELATNGSNRAFNENIANRLWAMMLGRGIVHPLDMIHPDNPAASPALLTQLGSRFAAMNFDMKMFLREIALSDVYQRPFDLTPEAVPSLAAARAEHQQLVAQKESLEVLARDAGSVFSDADTAFAAAETAMLPVAAEVDGVRTQYTDAKKKVDEAQKALNDATAAFNSKKSFADTLQQAAAPLQVAAASLPSDAELAATAAKLTEKANAVAAELPALEKAVADKTAAVTPLNEALATRSTLDAAILKLQPLQAAVRAEEAKVVTARTAMQEAQLKAASVANRIAVLERVSSASDLNASLASLTQTTATAEMAMAMATQQVTEYMPTVAARANAMTEATQSKASADSGVKVIQEQISRDREITKTLTEAADAMKRAQSSLPAEESLTTGLATITAKVSTLESQLKSVQETLIVASQMSSAAAEAMKAAKAAMDESNAELQRRQQVAAQAGTTLAQTKESLQTTTVSLEKAMDAVPTDLSSTFALSQLKPLSPEQMCWTIFKVTTVYDRYVAQEAAEREKASPLSEQEKQDPVVLAARAAEVEQLAYDKLKGNIGSYVQIYGGAPGQPQNDFYASPDQALFTANGGAINSWVVPAGDNATERIVKTTDARVAAEELYLGILTRMPTEQESAEVAAFLAARPDRAKAAQELVWGLISSAEFRFNR
jgi:uncharacterized FlaG/YvyC family protein